MSFLLACCLVINEISFAPDPAANEFVELYNPGPSPADLIGWRISDQSGSAQPISGRSLVIPAGDYVVLVRDPDLFMSAFPATPFIHINPWPTLNNDADEVRLLNNGILADAVPYEASWGLPRLSLERIDPSGPSDHRVNWGASTDPRGGTPGKRNAIHRPDRTPPRLIFADRVGQDSVFAFFDEPVALGSAVFRTSADAVAARMVDDRSLALRAPPGAELQVFGAADLFGNEAGNLVAPIADAPRPGDLFISERLVRPTRDRFDGKPDEPYFAELSNRGNRLVSLRRLALATPEDESGDRDCGSIGGLPTGLMPSETAVILSNMAEGRAAFGLSSATVVLEADAGLIRNRVLLLFGECPTDDGAPIPLDEAHYASEWFGPSDPEAGRSLHRVGPDGASPLGWASSTGTPPHSPGVFDGLPDTPGGVSVLQPGDLAITEVLFDAAEDQIEFVEIVARRAIHTNGAWLRMRRGAAPPDSVRLIYRPSSLSAGSVLVGIVPVSGTAVADLASRAQAAFPGAPAGTHWLGLRGAKPLRDTGFGLEIISPAGQVVEQLDASPDLHHPALRDTDGVSLVRRSLEVSALEPSNWTSSSMGRGPTPGFGLETEFRDRSTPSHALAPSGPNGISLSVEPSAFDPEMEATRIVASTGAPTSFLIEIYSRQGHLVRTLTVLGDPEADVFWDGRNEAGLPQPPGIYIVLATSDSGRIAKRVVVIGRRRQ